MATLSPIVSEFETDEQADEYDQWFRAKVVASLADKRDAVPHDEVMAELEVIIDRSARQRATR